DGAGGADPVSGSRRGTFAPGPGAHAGRRAAGVLARDGAARIVVAAGGRSARLAGPRTPRRRRSLTWRRGRMLVGHRRIVRRPRRRVPRLEALEDRVVLATVTWINPAGGDWDTPANWSSGSLPGGNDDAVIALPGIVVTHTGIHNDTVH